MTMRIDISPEEQAAYEAQARTEGLSLEDWLKKLADERAGRPAPGASQGQKLVEACAKVRGLMDDLDFSRNRSAARPIDL